MGKKYTLKAAADTFLTEYQDAINYGIRHLRNKDGLTDLLSTLRIVAGKEPGTAGKGDLNTGVDVLGMAESDLKRISPAPDNVNIICKSLEAAAISLQKDILDKNLIDPHSDRPPRPRASSIFG